MNAQYAIATYLIAFLPFLHAQPGTDAALPDPRQLKAKTLAIMKQSEKDLEKYSCLATEQADELNSDGTLKRRHSKKEEQFFVDGVEIDHVLARDGKELTGDAAKKEQERVDKEVKKYSDPKQSRKIEAEDEKQLDMFLRALKFSNGQREIRSGRNTVSYNLARDPAFHPQKLEERFAQALTGRIWLDEESGNLVELRVQTDRDVKVGGGLLATVHKGFQLHVLQQRQSDGVWITQAVDGTGDVRAALLFHPRFRFKQELDKCHLFSVETKQAIGSFGSPSSQAPEKP